MKFSKLVVIVAVTMVLLVSILIGAMVFTAKPAVKAEHSLPKYTTRDGIMVLLAAYNLADKVCESNNQYFIHFEQDGDFSGWYNFKYFEFKQLANGKWYHDNVDASNFQSLIGFDPKGLTCETKVIE